MSDPRAKPRLTFTRSMRIKLQGDFARVQRVGRRTVIGPIVCHVARAHTARSRLGIRIGRRVGSAPVRNRIKRLLREAFRLTQHHWTGRADVVIIVRAHEVLPQNAYVDFLLELIDESAPYLRPDPREPRPA